MRIVVVRACIGMAYPVNGKPEDPTRLEAIPAGVAAGNIMQVDLHMGKSMLNMPVLTDALRLITLNSYDRVRRRTIFRTSPGARLEAYRFRFRPTRPDSCSAKPVEDYFGM